MDSEWPDSLSAPVPVREPVEVPEGALGGALPTAPEERQPGALPETHQGLLLYPNPTLYWEDWPGSLSSSEKDPRVGSPCCPCGQGAETPKHILLHCEWFQNARAELEGSGRVNMEHLLCTEVGARKLSHWWLRHGVLQQFSLTRVLKTGVEGR